MKRLAGLRGPEQRVEIPMQIGEGLDSASRAARQQAHRHTVRHNDLRRQKRHRHPYQRRVTVGH